MSNTSEHFTQAAERFDRSPTSQQLSAMAEKIWPLLALDPKQHWLDFGAGTGVFSVPLAQHVAQVTALDTSAAMLERLAAKQVTNIAILNQDIFTGLDQHYDGIISSMALHHVADTQRLLNCMRQALVSGGQLALIDLYAEDGSFHGDNDAKGVKHLGFEPDVLMQQAEHAGFHLLKLQHIFSIEKRTGQSYPLFLLLGTAR